jgi:ABC-type glutathione transport system ATPase component
VPRLAPTVSYAVVEPASSLGVLVLIWRHPGLIALQLALIRLASLMREQLAFANGVGSLYEWVDGRVGGKRRRRIGAALRGAAEVEVDRRKRLLLVDGESQQQHQQQQQLKVRMTCLDPYFCEPFMVPTRGDDPRLMVAGAAGGTDDGVVKDDDAKSESGMSPSSKDVGSSDMMMAESSSDGGGNKKARSKSARPSAAAAGDDDDAVVEQRSIDGASADSSSSSSQQQQEEDQDELADQENAELEESEAMMRDAERGGAVPDSVFVEPGFGDDGGDDPDDDVGEDDGLGLWRFPQLVPGQTLHDTNARQERALRGPTLGLALLLCAIVDDERWKKPPPVEVAASSTLGTPAAAIAADAKKPKRKGSGKKARSWADVPRVASLRSSTLGRLFVAGSSSSSDVFSAVRWPTTPLQINRALAPYVRQISPRYAVVHDAAAEEIESRVKLLLEEEEAAKKQKNKQRQEEQQQREQAPNSFARYVIGRRYSLAPTARSVAKLFETERFRAMRAAGFEVETIVACSSVLLEHPGHGRFEQEHDLQRMQHHVVDGAHDGFISIASAAHRRIFPRQQPQQNSTKSDDRHSNSKSETGEDDDEDDELSAALLDDPQVAMDMLRTRLVTNTLERHSLTEGGGAVGDVLDFEVMAIQERAENFGGRDLAGTYGGMNADVLDNPAPLTSSSGASNGEDAMAAWLFKGTKCQRKIDVVPPSSAASASAALPDPTTATEWEWEFRDVSFAYPSDADKLVLHRVSFKLPAHSFVGIVGLSGSGKTTILALMLRIYDPTKGEILLNGRPLRDFPPRWLRRHLAYVGPLCSLLAGESGTAVEEVASANPLASADQIFGALRDAMVPDKMFAAAEEREERRNGTSTSQEKSGEPQQHHHHHRLPAISTMSGGEAQRVQIARAFAKMHQQGSSVVSLLFDEGTSSLDSKTEAHIVRAIEQRSSASAGQNAPKRPTRICVAHRIFTVRDCDKLLIIFKGHLVAQGTFIQCLKAAYDASGGSSKKKSTLLSKNTQRGLRWFLRSVQAQALQGETVDLASLAAAVAQDRGPEAELSDETAAAASSADEAEQKQQQNADDEEEEEEESFVDCGEPAQAAAAAMPDSTP